MTHSDDRLQGSLVDAVADAISAYVAEVVERPHTIEDDRALARAAVQAVREFDAAGGTNGSPLVGFKPDPEAWTVRRCPIHELVPAADEWCPVILDYSSCGLRLSEPFEVKR